MRYRIRVINLSRGVNLETVQNDLDELHTTFLASEQYLGKMSEDKIKSVHDSITYAKGLVSIAQQYKIDNSAGPARLKIA